MLLAFGVVCALFETQRSGRGQVIDAAMVDGAALLMAMFHGMRWLDFWRGERGSNLLDTGAPFYEVYETADGKHVSVGAIEGPFYQELLRIIGLEPADLPDQMDREHWSEVKERFAEVFRTKTRDEWCEAFDGTEACFAPVLTMDEAPEHPHNLARGTFVEVDGVTQPAPAPRFSRTKPEILLPPTFPGQHTDEVLTAWGFSSQEVAGLRSDGAIG
jgi:alpha-methylacyl-CoA racemase